MALAAASFALLAFAGVTWWWLSRSVLFQCTDLRTKLPVFIRIESGGTVRLDVHDRDGQIYVFGGFLPNYSRLSDDTIIYQSYGQSVVSLDRQTGSFSVTDESGQGLYSGLCRL